MQNMLNGIWKNELNSKITLDKLAGYIIRGGWPSNIQTPEDKIGIIPKSYIEAILEFNDGEYAAIEIKLGYNQVNEEKSNLISFYNNMKKKPKFMCVIVGFTDIIERDLETGIYIVPITALKP